MIGVAPLHAAIKHAMMALWTGSRHGCIHNSKYYDGDVITVCDGVAPVRGTVGGSLCVLYICIGVAPWRHTDTCSGICTFCITYRCVPVSRWGATLSHRYNMGALVGAAHWRDTDTLTHAHMYNLYGMYRCRAMAQYRQLPIHI